MEKIRVARAHKVARWFKEGLEALISDQEKITRADIQTLGAETAATILLLKEQAGNSSVKAAIPQFLKEEDIQCGVCSSRLLPLRAGYSDAGPHCECCGHAPQKFTLSTGPSLPLSKKTSMLQALRVPDMTASQVTFKCCGRAQGLGTYFGCAYCHQEVSENHPVVLILPLSRESTNVECMKLIEAEFQDDIAALMMD